MASKTTTDTPRNPFLDQPQCQGCGRFDEGGQPGTCEVLTFHLDVHGPEFVMTGCGAFVAPAKGKAATT